eukprot:INCI9142.4.p1 GENE.INCI9142.4~~INCI9142.4.p1  ORF type:complete len:984 (+),score=126.33 INCI9142.4:332-2953(+)
MCATCVLAFVAADTPSQTCPDANAAAACSEPKVARPDVYSVQLSAEEHLWLVQRRSSAALQAKLTALRQECDEIAPIASQEAASSTEDGQRARKRLQDLSAYAGLSIDFDSPCKAVVFQDDHFQGWSHEFGIGDHPLSSWPEPAKGDDLSSMRVLGHCRVTLFQGRKLGGKWRAEFSRGSYPLQALEAGGAKNDRTNSLRVSPLPKSEKWKDLATLVRDGIDALLSKFEHGTASSAKPDHSSEDARGKKVKPAAKESAAAQQGPDCTLFLSCDDCLDGGCGWCISDRTCVPDEPWICLGEHDHVGKFSDRLVKQCPTPEEHETVALIDDAASTAADNKVVPVGGDVVVESLTCLGWHQTAGCNPQGEREPHNDRSCEVVVPVGVSGYCACAPTGGSDPEPDLANIIRTALADCSEDREPWTCDTKCATLQSELLLQQEVRRKEAAELRAQELERVRKEVTGSDSEEDRVRSAQAGQKCKEIREFMDRIKDLQGMDGGDRGPGGRTENDNKNRNENAARLGAEFPYEVLEVEFTAVPSTIRKAYRKRSLWLHPDKAPESCKALAANAFSALVAAYEILGNPDTREMFDDFGEAEQEQFFSRWEWEKYASNKHAKDFYTRDPLITNLKEASWDRRVGGEETSIWLVEFYAPWCKACQDFSTHFKMLAKELSDDDVEVGAVNCETQIKACRDWFAVPSYPTLRLINRHHGMQQDYSRQDVSKQLTADGVAAWVRTIAAEWRVLFSRSNITELTPKTFNAALFGDDQSEVGTETNGTSWFVLFTDGTACGPCRTAKTNLMRLGASAAGLSVRVAFVDCKRHRSFCRNEHQAPQAPHAPYIKAWPRTVAQRKRNREGVMLYVCSLLSSVTAGAPVVGA